MKWNHRIRIPIRPELIEITSMLGETIAGYKFDLLHKINEIVFVSRHRNLLAICLFFYFFFNETPLTLWQWKVHTPLTNLCSDQTAPWCQTLVWRKKLPLFTVYIVRRTFTMHSNNSSFCIDAISSVANLERGSCALILNSFQLKCVFTVKYFFDTFHDVGMECVYASCILMELTL